MSKTQKTKPLTEGTVISAFSSGNKVKAESSLRQLLDRKLAHAVDNRRKAIVTGILSGSK